MNHETSYVYEPSSYCVAVLGVCMLLVHAATIRGSLHKNTRDGHLVTELREHAAFTVDVEDLAACCVPAGITVHLQR